MWRRKKRGDLKPHNSSIILNLKPVLDARNILHPSAFLVKLGLNPVSANKMLNGKSVQINYRQLTTLCLHLNCTPNDILETREMQLPPGHALEKLAPKPDLISPTDFLQGKTMEELNEILRK